MNGIQDSGINQLLTRRLNITDSPGPASTLAPEVMPVFLVSPSRPEENFLRYERLASVWSDAAGGAASYGSFRIYNPAGSQTIGILEHAIIRHVTALRVYCAPLLGGANSDLLDTPGTTLWDTRYRATAGNQQTVLQCQSGVETVPPGAGGPILAGWRRSANETTQTDLGIVIAPGYCVDFWASAVNVQFEINLYFRERTAQPSELG